MAKRRESIPAPKTPEVRRRHLSRAEREQRMNRIVLAVAIVLSVAVVVLLVVGVLYEAVIKPNEPVAIVGDVSISTARFENHVKLQRMQTILQLANLAPIYGTCDTADQQSPIYSLCQQLQFPSLMGSQVLNSLVEGEVIRQEAAARGITATDEEIQARINEAFFYDPNPQPPAPTEEPTATPTPRFTATPSATPTPSTTPTETPEDAETATPTLPPSETPTPRPTLTADERRTQFEEDYASQIALVTSLTGLDEQQYRATFEVDVLREKLQEAITANIPAVVDQVNVRMMQVSTEAEAIELLEALRDGESFASLARNADGPRDANDPNRFVGGALGWVPRDELPLNVAAEAFSAEIGEVLGPIRDFDLQLAMQGQTQEYFYVVQVLGHEVRPLDAAILQRQREEFFNTWLSGKRTQAQTFDYWRNRLPEDPTEAQVRAELEKLFPPEAGG